MDLSGLDFWQFPLFLIVGHPQLPVKFIPDLVTFQAFVTPSYKKLREDGWLGKGRISSFEVAAADDQMAIISVKGDRLNEQGAVLNSWDLSYLLVRRGGQWMQACVMDKGPNLPEPEELYRWAHGLLSI
ncbi:hypothetical protein NSU_0450 [Novosphingobium pentaromativorans US6-1]|uniref:Uncharacterized protein n=1 Tax=Novosphingobium pentaromativorans US6-1 TaxID=1088721 RepID=G6E7X9_9SPHN|nr:hypothetical protein NSU_0450 [Novosphingobium pentaromativorans US6-1]